MRRSGFASAIAWAGASAFHLGTGQREQIEGEPVPGGAVAAEQARGAEPESATTPT
ncbi:hypothetical protein [Gemmatimonas sp.]|uniref:hypothetical protein n=1 Tax=Gemmatimonas sp. TaxID=1962908 RepID=UPI00286DB05D|nr:hypothetical protein [Gemmatimonas sp.]